MLRRYIQRIIAFICMFAILALPVTVKVQAIATTVVGSLSYTGRFYVIQNERSGKFLEVSNGNLTSGANVWQDSFNFDANYAQIFSLVLVSHANQPTTINGLYYYMFVPIGNTDLCLDVDNAYDANGTNIKVFIENPNDGAQYFTLIENNDGSFYIEPYVCRNSHRVLTVENDSTTNQANVVLGTKDPNNSSQRWIFKEIDPMNDPALINQNWSYFFHGTAGTEFRNISQRLYLYGSTDEELNEWHSGTDFPADEGTYIYSPCTAVVKQIVEDDRTMGNGVILQTKNKVNTIDGERYLTIRLIHMHTVSNNIWVNKEVGPSDWLGTVGDTGRSYGNHLHIDINNGDEKSGPTMRRKHRDGELTILNAEKFYLSKRFRYADEVEGFDIRLFATDIVY